VVTEILNDGTCIEINRSEVSRVLIKGVVPIYNYLLVDAFLVLSKLLTIAIYILYKCREVVVELNYKAILNTFQL
jgi:hypothetical protein